MKKMSLGTQTLLGMVAGGIVGFAVGPKIVAIQFVGDIFLRMLQMAIVPLIYVSVTTAIANMGDIKRLGRIGAKVVLLFLATSISASIFGVIIGRIGSPGKGLILRDLPPVTSLAESPSFTKIVLGMFPTNIVQAMSEANMLQIIVFALFSGVAILMLNEPHRQKVTGMFETLFQFVMKILGLVIATSPIGVFGLMAITAGKYGVQVVGPLAKFIATMYVGFACHLVLFMFVIYFAFTRRNPFTFFKTISPIWITSISTCSTKATMPIAMATCEEKLGVPKDVVGFTIPLGASTNMDGSALWFGVVGIFVTQLLGINMSLSQQFMTVFVAVLMTMGSTGIPGGTFVTTAVFLRTMGLPLEVMGLLGGIYRIIDMGLTTMNVLGTVFITAIVGHWESRSKATAEPSQAKQVGA
jgi:Na+/H+-dicarboxylate symporter